MRERVVGGAESISKLQAILFDPPSSSPLPFSYPDTLPRPFRGSFLQEKPLLSPLPFSFPFVSSLFLFREATCSPRILISSKVLFPLNRAATKNNALYVRVLRPASPLRVVARLFLSRFGLGTGSQRLPSRHASFDSSFRHASEFAIHANSPRRAAIFLIYRVS